MRNSARTDLCGGRARSHSNRLCSISRSAFCGRRLLSMRRLLAQVHRVRVLRTAACVTFGLRRLDFLSNPHFFSSADHPVHS
jgi:hypothetical protein